MFRVQRSLGNNAILAVSSENNKKYLIIGKGIGFGKRVTERIELRQEDTAYSIQEADTKIDGESIAKSVDPRFLEMSDYILKEAEKKFGHIDKGILFSMSDHIAFAVERLKRGETIHNPMIQDIKILFYQEFKIASLLKPIILETCGVEMNEDEIGYVTLHIHSALKEENVSEAAILAQAVRICVEKIEKYTGCSIDTMSLSYNRLMNHIRYMMLRVRTGEKLELNMNEYMNDCNHEIFNLSEKICNEIESEFRYKLEPAEAGYLAIHIQRIKGDMQKN